MTVAEIINRYARPYSPYMGGLVNHLPMGQLALYMMENDVVKVESYSKNYIENGNIDRTKEEYAQVGSIEEYLGKRDLYEGCLDFIMAEISSKGADDVIKKIVNDYSLGISSGLFHTTIRLAYGIRGMALDSELTEEVTRALAYYVTAYRAGETFSRRVPSAEFAQAVQGLLEDPHVIELISGQPTRGKRMKALYEDKIYLKKAPIIEGSVDDKVIGLLGLLLPLLDKTNNIVILHCITGLQALLVLEKYFDDFPNAVDIMTACIITHLLTVEDVVIETVTRESIDQSWKDITERASKSSDVHTIKFVYSAKQLYQRYELPALKQSALRRMV